MGRKERREDVWEGMMAMEKILVLVISDCRDCPFIEERTIKELGATTGWALRPHCAKTGSNLYTGTHNIPIPQDCKLPDPILMETVKAAKKKGG